MKVLLLCLSFGTEENHGRPKSQQLVFRLIFALGTPEMGSRCVTYYIVMFGGTYC